MSGSVARSQSSYNSFASSIQQDVILDVPNPLTSSCSVASFAFFDDKAHQATISDLDDDVGNTPLSEDPFKIGASSTPVLWKNPEVSHFPSFPVRDPYYPLDQAKPQYNFYCPQYCGGPSSPPTSKISSNSSNCWTSSSLKRDAQCLLDFREDNKSVTTNKTSPEETSSKRRAHTDAVCDPKDPNWKPIVPTLRGFDISVLAPQSCFTGDKFSEMYPAKTVFLPKDLKKRRPFKPFDEAIAIVRGMEYSVWPEFKEKCYNSLVQRNHDRAYIYCNTYCECLGKKCRFWVSLTRKMDEKTGREYAQIASCFLNHDCRSAQVIEHDVKFNIHHDYYRRRNVKMKTIVPNSTFLSVFDKQPDLTKNNGITSLQIQRSVERESQTIPLTSSQSFNFLSGKNLNCWRIHAHEFTLFPDLFLKLQQQDPEGLYVVNLLPLRYEIPGVSSADLSDALMFDYSICIPSACKHFYEYGNQIAVIDGAHLYTKFEGVMLTMCAKDGEDHIVEIGFAIVPLENKYYWQEFMNAIFHYITHHRMIMADKAKGMKIIVFKDLCIKVDIQSIFNVFRLGKREIFN
jgi:hypothetical protein